MTRKFVKMSTLKKEVHSNMERRHSRDLCEVVIFLICQFKEVGRMNVIVRELGNCFDCELHLKRISGSLGGKKKVLY